MGVAGMGRFGVRAEVTAYVSRLDMFYLVVPIRLMCRLYSNPSLPKSSENLTRSCLGEIVVVFTGADNAAGAAAAAVSVFAEALEVRRPSRC